jgi:rubredoxin
MEVAKIYKCPRCKLPQKETYRCQFCGYVFSKNKKHTKTIRNKLANIIDGLYKDQIYTAKKPKLSDNSGTRSGTDRRKYKLMNYFPERRSGKDRRKKVKRGGSAARKRL